MLQKYCACHEKVEPRHTKSCNCHAKWSLQSNTSVTWNLRPFHGFSVECFKHRHHKPQNPCDCHAKRIVSDPLQFKSTTPANVFATLTNSCACHVFCNVSKSLRLPRETHFQPQKTSRAPGVLTILTSESFARAGVVQILGSSTSKSVPNMQRGAFFFRINRSRAQAWCKFCRCQLPKVLRHRQFLTILTSQSLSRAGVVQILSRSTSKSAPGLRVLNDFDFQIALARRRGANFVEILGTRSSAPPRFSDLPLRTFEATKLRKNTAFRAIPTRQNISAVKHRCCKSYRQLSV